MGEHFKAIVIVGRRAYVFEAFSTALSFMRSHRAETLFIEFSVETDTLDFYDAVKMLGVPVVFSANRLELSLFAQLGIRASEIVFPERRRPLDSFADYRPRPGIHGSSCGIRMMSSRALLDA